MLKKISTLASTYNIFPQHRSTNELDNGRNLQASSLFSLFQIIHANLTQVLAKFLCYSPETLFS